MGAMLLSENLPLLEEGGSTNPSIGSISKNFAISPIYNSISIKYHEKASLVLQVILGKLSKHM